MKKIMDKLLNNIKFDKRYVFFCLVLVILGIITGSLFVVILNGPDKNIVIEYIESFIDSLKNNNFDYIKILQNTLISNYIIIFIISIIGFTYFFIPINIIILFYKSFIIGFSLSSFILTFINILLVSILTAFTLKLSINMVKCIIKKKDVNMRIYFNKYLSILIVFVGLLSITSIYESFVVPYLLKLLIKII